MSWCAYLECPGDDVGAGLTVEAPTSPPARADDPSGQRPWQCYALQQGGSGEQGQGEGRGGASEVQRQQMWRRPSSALTLPPVQKRGPCRSGCSPRDPLNKTPYTVALSSASSL